jgi:Flp pilus assembly protein TadD
MERNAILPALLRCTAMAFGIGVLPTMALAQPGNDDMLAGLSALRTSDHARAERSFTNAVAERPDDARAWYYRGVNRLTMGDATGAIADLDRMLALDPGNGNGLLRRAEAHLMTGAADAATTDLKTALAHYPDGPVAEHALLQLGHQAILKGDFATANGHFDHLVSIAPDNALGRCNRGIALAAVHADAEALGELDRALELDPTLEQAHVHRAIVLLRNGRKPEACAALQRAHVLGDTSVEEMLLIYCE